MGGLEHVLVGGQRQPGLDQLAGFRLEQVELVEQRFHVGVFEVEGGHLHLVLQEDVAVGDLAEGAVGPHQVVHRVHVLQVHGEPFQAVGDLAGDRVAVDAADLLEVGELGHLHAVQPDFPAQAPGAQGGRFPVVFHEADVMGERIETEAAQGIQIQLLDVVRRRLEHHLELVVMLQPVGVLAVAAVGGPPGRLHVGAVPVFRADRAQEGAGVEGAGPHFHIQGLDDHAALLRPVLLQGQNQALEGACIRLRLIRHGGSRSSKLCENKGASIASPRGR